MPEQNALDRRAARLAVRMERRTNALVRRLTEPSPPFKVKVNEEDQTRVFLDRWQSGWFRQMRDSGQIEDADLDRYYAHGINLVAKHAPHMLVRSFQEPPELNSNPLNLHEGLVAALGLDGEPPSVEQARGEVGGTSE